MKKLTILLILIFLLSGCGNINEHTNTVTEIHSDITDTIFITTTTITQSPATTEFISSTNTSNESSISVETQVIFNNDEIQKTYSHEFLWDTPDNLIKLLYTNSIDLDMDIEGSEIYRTSEINQLVAKYNDIWKDEMNFIYEKLINHFDNDACIKLEKSQAAYNEISKYNHDIWSYVLNPDGKSHGTGFPAMIETQNMNIMKKRTFLLAEYYYWLTNEFEFNYEMEHNNINSSSYDKSEWKDKYLNDTSLFLYDTSNSFVEYMSLNQIEIDMENEMNKANTIDDKNQICNKYTDIWINEMNTAYKKLYNQLNNEIKMILEKSQESWEEENKYDAELWVDIFNTIENYSYENDVMIKFQSMNRIRKRTFLLAEYCWYIDDFKFSYNNSC